MKNFIYLLAIVLYCSSCSSCSLGNQSDSVEGEVDTAVVPEIENTITEPEPEPESEPEPSSQRAIYYEYEGELEGGIPIELKFLQSDDIVKGELIYKKVGKPITIIGTVDENGSYRVYEFGEKGMITGILSGNFESDAKNLSWFSPESRKRLKMELELKSKKDGRFDFGDNDMVGVYRYEFGKDGALGNLTVDKVTKDSIYFDLICLTHAPGRNMATLEEAAMPINGNKVSIDFKDDEYYDCAYDIIFYKDFVSIKYVDDRMECGFGHNARVEGIFVKQEKQ